MDSEKALHHRRVEHARNPETESSPRVADAEEAGAALFNRRLGQAGLEVLKEISPKTALSLSKRSECLRAFGRVLRQKADLETVPSRLEIHRQLIDDGEVDAGDLVAERVGNEYREAVVNSISEQEVRSVANRLLDEGEKLRN